MFLGIHIHLQTHQINYLRVTLYVISYVILSNVDYIYAISGAQDTFNLQKKKKIIMFPIFHGHLGIFHHIPTFLWESAAMMS